MIRYTEPSEAHTTPQNEAYTAEGVGVTDRKVGGHGRVAEHVPVRSLDSLSSMSCISASFPEIVAVTDNSPLGLDLIEFVHIDITNTQFPTYRVWRPPEQQSSQSH